MSDAGRGDDDRDRVQHPAHLDRAAWLWSIAKLGANGRLLWNASLGSADWSARVFPLGDGGAIVVMEGARQLGAERFVVRRLDVDGRESAPRVLLCPSDCTTLSDVALASDGDLLLVRDGTLVKLGDSDAFYLQFEP